MFKEQLLAHLLFRRTVTTRSRHTPAPWVVERNGLGELAPFSVDGTHLLSSDGPEPLPLAEREANGRVIEIAPELFERFEWFMDFCDTRPRWTQKVFSEGSSQGAWLKAVRALAARVQEKS